MKTPKISFILLLLGWVNLSYSQKSEWQTIANSNGVSISCKIAECEFKNVYAQEWLLLRYENENPYPVRLDFELQKILGTTKVSDPRDNLPYSLSIDPNSMKQGVCNEVQPSFLYVFLRFTDSDYHGRHVQRVADRVKISNLTIVKEVPDK